MTTANFSATAAKAINAFDTTAQGAVGAYLAGGKRLGQMASKTWTRTFNETSARLTPETCKNAMHAKHVFSGYYTKGLQMSADGAHAAVTAVVQAANVAVERTAAFIETRSSKAV